MGHIIEGRNAVIEALRAGVSVSAVLVAQGVGGPPVEEVRTLAEAAGVPVKTVPKRMLDERSARGAHQGVMAEVASFGYSSLGEIISRSASKTPSLVIVLDHITDEGNLGAIARSAEVVGADGLIMPKARSAKVGPVAQKTSAGALSHLPVAREANMVQALTALKDAGYWVAGASEKAEMLAWDAPLEGRLALVMGGEGEGLSRLVEQSCDFLVRLPVAGSVSSLNVAQATTVLAFEWARRGAVGQ